MKGQRLGARYRQELREQGPGGDPNAAEPRQPPEHLSPEYYPPEHPGSGIAHPGNSPFEGPNPSWPADIDAPLTPSAGHSRASLFGVVLVLLTFAAGGFYIWKGGPWGGRVAAGGLGFLGGSEGGERLAAAAAASAQSVSVASYPAGATVLLDFDSIGVTPLEHYPVEPGAYILSLRKEGAGNLDTVVFVEQGVSLFQFDLAPGVVDGALWASDAWTQSDEFPGTDTQDDVAAAVVRPQVAPASASVASAGATETSRTSTGSRDTQGMLVVLSEPPGGTVYVDETAVGETPLIWQNVRPGLHTVSIRREGYAPFTTEVDLDGGDALKVEGQLVALTGTLQVIIEPWGSIYIDGKLHRQDTDVQYRTDLLVGRHHVRVVHPSLGTWERTVKIEGGATQQLAIHFQEGLEASGSSATENGATESNANTTGEIGDASDLLDENGIYKVAEEPPQFSGSMEDLYRKARYPKPAYEAKIEGKVFLRFVVDEQGLVSRAYVTRGIGMGCDEEALRLIRTARFEPGKIHGVPVRVWHAMYINFEIKD